MAERLREVAEIPQQFIKEGTLVCQLFILSYCKLIISSLTDVRNLPRMVCVPSISRQGSDMDWDEGENVG
jgi:hypothetical protein